MLLVVHAKTLYYQVIHNLCLSLSLRMERCRDIKYRVELFPESPPKYVDKYGISIGNDGRRKAIVFPNMFEEELSNLVFYCSLLTWNEDSHLGKFVEYY